MLSSHRQRSLILSLGLLEGDYEDHRIETRIDFLWRLQYACEGIAQCFDNFSAFFFNEPHELIKSLIDWNFPSSNYTFDIIHH